MDAPGLTAEQSSELDRLRVRAYGPDADIASDPQAMARLSELEALCEARGTSAGADDRDLAEDAPLVAPALEEPAPALDGLPPASTGATSTTDLDEPMRTPEWARPATGAPGADPEAPASPAVWWRTPRARTVGIAAIAGVAGLLIGFLMPAPGVRAPDLRLAVSSESPEPAWQSDLADWQIDMDSLASYERLDGLGVWTGRSESGNRCLLLSHGLTLTLATCTAPDLNPTFDLVIDDDVRTYLQWDYPAGAVVRMVAGPDSVDVWIRDPVNT